MQVLGLTGKYFFGKVWMKPDISVICITRTVFMCHFWSWQNSAPSEWLFYCCYETTQSWKQLSKQHSGYLLNYNQPASRTPPKKSTWKEINIHFRKMTSLCRSDVSDVIEQIQYDLFYKFFWSFFQLISQVCV